LPVSPEQSTSFCLAAEPWSNHADYDRLFYCDMPSLLSNSVYVKTATYYLAAL
jgi:hypothetical protein